MGLSLKLIGKVIKKLIYYKLECAHCNCFNINEKKNINVEIFVCLNLMALAYRFSILKETLKNVELTLGSFILL